VRTQLVTTVSAVELLVSCVQEEFFLNHYKFVNWDGLVGIATGYGLDDQGIGV
jgi:hypothetical protein